MAHDPNDVVGTVIRLAINYKKNFVELGKLLRQLQVDDPPTFKEVSEKAALGLREAYYLAKITRQIEKLPIPTGRLASIGWTKTMIVGKYLNAGNWVDMLDLAERTNARDLKLIMKGGRPTPGTRSVVLDLTPAEYNLLKHAVVQNGGQVKGDGLLHKERAVMKIITKVGMMQ